MKSEKGFATVLLMTVLPGLLAFAAASYFLFALLKQDLATLNVCRAFELQVQNKVGVTLGKLLKLNPKARRLREEEKKAKEALRIATQTANAPAIAAAELALAVATGRRMVLGIRQRVLMASADAELASGGARLGPAIQREFQTHQRPLSSWLEASLSLKTSRVPTLQVKADQPDMAPVYEPVSDFEETQSWLQSWSVRFRGAGVFKTFFQWKGQIERSCSTSLYGEGTKWKARLKNDVANADKSWSKGWF